MLYAHMMMDIESNLLQMFQDYFQIVSILVLLHIAFVRQYLHCLMFQ